MSRHSLYKWLRNVLKLIVVGYALGLSCYLLMRLVLGDRFWWLAFLNNFAPFYFLPLLVVVPLALVLRSRFAVLFTVFLALIAVVWFGPYYLPKAHPVPSATTLHIVTFNVWGDNRRLTDVEAWLRQTNADVVFMQEIPATFAENGLPQLKDLYPYQLHPDWQWSNIALSRYPFVTSEYLDLTDNGSRPAQERVTLDIGGQMVVLYNVHLALPTREVPRKTILFGQPFTSLLLSYDDAARNIEIKNLLARLEKESSPYIVAGDFNTSDQTVVYHDLAARMSDTFREVGVGLGASWPISSVAGLPGFIPPFVRIDYVWHSAQFRAVDAQQGPQLGSDHLPLYATLDILKPS